MEIKVFLSLPNPSVYDFKAECQSDKFKIDPSKTGLENFLRYKIDSPRYFDADGSGENTNYVSTLLRTIYKELFLWNYSWDTDKSTCSRYALIENLEGIEWGPDTMNTFMIAPLPHYLSDTSLLTDYIKKLEPKQKRISTQMLYRVVVENALSGLTNYLSVEDYKKWNDFAALIHTLGNFVLVPAGFNPDRARCFADYWDFSLRYLNTKLWKKEGFFNWYINHFFLWDYVKKAGNTYRTKSLLDSAFATSEPQIWYFQGEIRYPKLDKASIKVWMTNVSFAIKRRGQLMVSLLKLKQRDSETFTKLRRKFFDSFDSIGDFEYVVNAICEYIKDEEIKKELSKLCHE